MFVWILLPLMYREFHYLYYRHHHYHNHHYNYHLHYHNDHFNYPHHLIYYHYHSKGNNVTDNNSCLSETTSEEKPKELALFCSSCNICIAAPKLLCSAIAFFFLLFWLIFTRTVSFLRQWPRYIQPNVLDKQWKISFLFYPLVFLFSFVPLFVCLIERFSLVEKIYI